MLLDRSVLAEEPLVNKILQKTALTLYECYQNRGPSEKRDGNCHILADSRWDSS
jgi:hypothetical protein